jgi:XTP/dITP diphosphohydrolase
VEALGGQPGIYAARFAGEGCSYGDNVRKVLGLLEGVPEKFRKAVFRTVVSFVFPGEDPVFLDGEAPGIITEGRRGLQGFGYDPIFKPEGSSKVFAEMTMAEKNKVSHRGKALQKVERFLRNKFHEHSV